MLRNAGRDIAGRRSGAPIETNETNIVAVNYKLHVPRLQTMQLLKRG